jgi:hypothetical protein
VLESPRNVDRNEKGCDFGYALAANSCEGATGVDACTVTALCAITAFAASKPRLTPRSAVGFFGSGGRPGRPAQPITQLTLEQLHKCCCPFLPLTEAVTLVMPQP